MSWLIKLIIWIAFISGGVFFWQYSSFESTILTDEETTVEISSWGFQNALINAGANPTFTKLYLRENAPDFDLQKWKYIIPENATVKVYLESLQNPLNEGDVKITFLEWWNIYDIDQTLSNGWYIQSWEFSRYVTTCDEFCILKTDYAFISDAESLEWFLYPDTYNINPNNFRVETLVRKMLTRFEQKVINSGIINDMGSIEILDIINMASIVQKETAFKKYINGREINKSKEEIFEEASTVAGVLKKRLNEWWQIGADATVCYAFNIGTQQCTPSKVLEYLYEVNQYNTRQMTGLPVWPIANPQDIIIEATINSKSTPYYYYLHAPDGQIYYGRTNAEHERNKQLYLR